jgi:membrane-associated protease RseP (regulator of RpoE activity)
MKVTEFFIGFGPRIWSFRRGETEYGLKVIPAGAYVRIIGMHNLEEVDPADEARTYRSKSTTKRVAAVLAGPAMNLLIGLVLLFVLFAGFGAPRPDRWQVNEVLPGSAAAAAGLQVGDRIVELEGQPVGVYSDFVDQVRPLAGDEVDLVVERGGERFDVTAPLGWRLSEEGAALVAPLQRDDEVLEVDGRPVGSYAEFTQAMADADGSVAVLFERSGERFRTQVEGPVELPADGARGLLGITQQVPSETEGVVGAAGEATSTFGDVVVASVQGLGRFFSPEGLSNYAELFTDSGEPTSTAPPADITPVDPGTPVPEAGAPSASSTGGEDRVLSILGVVRLGSDLAQEDGAESAIFLLATVNIFLALINLVPLLPFDGGHIAVALYEGVRSRLAGRPYRADVSKLMPITYVVVFLMIGLGVSSMYLDVVNPVNL